MNSVSKSIKYFVYYYIRRKILLQNKKKMQNFLKIFEEIVYFSCSKLKNMILHIYILIYNIVIDEIIIQTKCEFTY